MQPHLLLILLSSLLWPAGHEPWRFRCIDGQSIELNDANTKATVFVFVTTDCPIANAYQPKLRELQEEFASQGIKFVEVYPVPSITREAVLKHRSDYKIRSSSLLDPDRTLAKRLGAKVTPEAIVLDRAEKVLYRGRIDDQHAALGKKRPEPTKLDLTNALKAIVADQPVAVPETTAVGCLIRY